MVYGKLNADIIEHSDGTSRNVNRLVDGSTANTLDDDLSMTNENKGFILIDRSDTTKKYRLYVDNGSLGIEEA